MINVVALGSLDEAQGLAEEWGVLHAGRASDIFTSPAWCLASWRILPDLGPPLLLVAVDGAGVLLGALPLTNGPMGPAWPGSPLGDEHDVRIRRDEPAHAVVSALLRLVPRVAEPGKTVLMDVRPGGLLTRAAPGRVGCPAPVVGLNDPDEEFGALGCLPGWSRKQRRTLRSARRRLEDFSTLRLAEDVFVMLADAESGPTRRVAESLVTRADLERGLSVWTRFAGHLHSSMTYRVVARVVDESRFKRTELRDAVTTAVAVHRPRWRVADPAQLELWVLEHQRATFVAGLRLLDKRMRQHGSGRATERHGAPRPVVAAAMIRLAGEPPGRLLDPCCGTGTLLWEALAAGWWLCTRNLTALARRFGRHSALAGMINIDEFGRRRRLPRGQVSPLLAAGPGRTSSLRCGRSTWTCGFVNGRAAWTRKPRECAPAARVPSESVNTNRSHRAVPSTLPSRRRPNPRTEPRRQTLLRQNP
jgi:Putative RNA methylase family UPF0020